MTWEFLGNKWAVSLLKSQITSGGLRHAYLFCGPTGVGRRTLALHFAQALNCPQPISPGVPCGTCRTCIQTGRMQHPDLVVVQSDEGSHTIKVDQVRQLQQTLSLTAYQSPYRVALLINFEEATTNAQNALLKTLEEAPDNVVLILTAQSTEMLLPTIVSRCEVLQLHPLPLGDLTKALQERWDIPPDEASLLARLSTGSPGCALRLHQNPAEMEDRRVYLQDALLMLSLNRRERFAYVENTLQDREKLRLVLGYWLSLWRDVCLAVSGTPEYMINVDFEEEIGRISDLVDLETVRKRTSDLLQGLWRLDANVNPRLLAEVILLDWPMIMETV